jgi:hypothetical protein
MALHHPSRPPHLFKTARLTVNKDHVDLSQGETPETTTTIGLRLLEQFRKTIDKQYVEPSFYILCDNSIITSSLVDGYKPAILCTFPISQSFSGSVDSPTCFLFQATSEQ